MRTLAWTSRRGLEPEFSLEASCRLLLVAEFKFEVLITSQGVSMPRDILPEALAPFQGIPIFAKCMSSRTEILTGEVGEKDL